MQNGTSICTGQDANGLRVTTPGTTVAVASGATVTGAGAAAIVVDTLAPNGTIVALDVQGLVDGGAASGVSLLSARNSFGSVRLDVTVGAEGRITGATGVVIGRNPASNGFPSVTATIDNAGRIEGTNGAALGIALSNFGGFSTITNRAAGTIGAIAAPVGTLSNAGTIDGGAASAIDTGSTTGGTTPGTWTNTGTITSASTGGTVANMAQRMPGLTNAGIVRNTGSGAALSGDHVTVRNSGTISAASGTAITAGLALALTNTGTITGNVLVNTPSGFGLSGLVDSSAGTINGNVTFGQGSDTLVARYTGTPTLQTGITGTINGGASINAVQINAPENLTIATGVVLPTNFQRLRLTPTGGATVTLAPGFVSPGTVEMTGIGTVTNAAAVVTTGTAFVAPINNDRNTLNVANTGSVRTANGVGFDLSSVGTFRNSGTIEVTNGVGVGLSTSNRFINSGTITATSTGVSAFATQIDNTGTIRSTAGIALAASGSSGTTVTNSGRIDGATFGVATSILLANSGTVTGGTAGVRLDAYGAVSNAAGGVISGARSISNNGASFNMTVANAGTLNGDVVLADQNNGSNNTFIALTGGVLNGNLVLGSNGRLVTDLTNTGPNTGQERFAGITGTVSVTNGTLRYRVASDAAATLGATPAPFTSVGYELANNARLTLTAPGTVAQPVLLAGTGRVDIDATLAASTQGAIQSVSATPDAGTFFIPANALAITSRGAVTLTRAPNTTAPVNAVALGSGDRFTNAGTITLSGANLTAIAGGAEVVNSGRITATASTNGVGILSGGRVTNTGTIETAGVGVSLTFGANGAGSLINSGTITSTNTPGVVGQAFGATVENLAGGTIGGRSGVALRGGTLVNAGTINGTVQLTIPAQGGVAFEPGVFVSAGGTVNGNVLFGAGDDLFLQLGETRGVTGRVVGGDGFDVYGRSYAASADVALGLTDLPDFEAQLVQARGADTTLTLTGGTATDLFVGGDGRIVNRATIDGAVLGYLPTVFDIPASVRATLGSDLVLADFRNEGNIAGGVDLSTRSFANTGMIGSDATDAEVSLYAAGDLRFDNSGTILTAPGEDAVDLFVDAAGTVAFANSGTIRGATEVDASYDRADVAGTMTVANSGTIATTAEETNALSLEAYATAGSVTVRLDNSGTLSAAGAASRAALLAFTADGGTATYAVTNSGLIEANGGGEVYSYPTGPTASAFYTEPASALGILGLGNVTGTVVNTGRIVATGARSVALGVIGGAVDLTNAGTITGSDGTLLDAADQLAVSAGTRYLAGAIQTLGQFDDVVRNSGTITGSIDLGAGNDRVENRGTIAGPVFLREGDDRLVLAANAVLGGGVDGGDGTDAIAIEATADGTVTADRFANFEMLTQSGSGTITYAGTFSVDTIALTGGAVRVAVGTTLATAGAVTVTGSDAAERVEVAGTLNGAVALGAGDDTFTEVGDGRVLSGVDGGGVDGGAGTDLYRLLLAGDRGTLSANTGFEGLAVEGSGTLTLAQGFDTVALAGTGLDIAARVTVGAITGSAAAERVRTGGDLARVALGAGDDELTLGAAVLAGTYAGEAGSDTLTLTNPNAVRLDGTATGFERVALAGNSLSVAGTLGAANNSLEFGNGAQTLSVLANGRLVGAFDLGAGDDRLRLAADSSVTGSVTGSVAGGAGSDLATIELAGDRALAATTLTGFERLATEGRGTLSLTGGAFAYDRVDASTDIRVASGASLRAATLAFGPADNRFTVEGGFAGSVSGGAGSDVIDVAGGSEAAPVAFANISEVEAFRMAAGFATVSGTGALGAIDLSGGRLVGLAGSAITATTIAVRQGATFGSAGTVTGNLSVAGTLSPGASPGTMTVNGNVALAGTSVSVFEITPTAYDRLVVNGSLSIAQGATLQLVPSGAITPGTTLDLITASGGISGSFTNVVKPASLLGFLVQDAGRIRLLGQFRTDTAFGDTTNATIAYTNAVLASGRASAALLAAAPRLVNASGVSNAAAFARIAPEAYASVRQAVVENGLVLADAGRGEGFAARSDAPGLFTFGQFSGVRRTLSGDAARARFNGYGVLGGVGYQGDGWSVGAFGGYLDGRQRIDALAARSDVDGGVVGVHARMTRDGFGLTTTLAYAGAEGTTRRTLFDGAVRGRYDLDTWTVDMAASYDVAVVGDWVLRPRLGATAIRTERGRIAETGGSAFAAQVARHSDRAVFVDGTLKLAGGENGAPVRSYAAIGVRYQVAGRDTVAVAGFSGGEVGLIIDGAERARALGTASLGAEADLVQNLILFGAATAERGASDHREAVRAGVRLHF